MFQPVFILIRSLVEKLSYKTTFQRRKALHAFTFSNASSLDLSDLSMQLLKAAEKAMTAKHACLLFPDYETGIYRPLSSTMPLTTKDLEIVLPEHNSASAFEIAEKILSKIQQMFFGTSQHDRRFLSVSIGLCTYPTAAPSQEELMMRADLALFSAKNSGKNKTVIYSPKLSVICKRE